MFVRLLETLPRPLTILDLGGTDEFWENLGFKDPLVRIILYNPRPLASSNPMFEVVQGDARDLKQYPDGSIDVVYSNSVIEHVGGIIDQEAMAHEIQRVAGRYFIQTPNYYFPIEPHFLFPGFQFLPVTIRAFLLTRVNLGWFKREPDFDRAMESVSSVKLLSPSEMRRLFPKAKFYRERFFGLTKSVVAYEW